MSADTDNRDQPDVQHRATASDSHTPGRPDAIESERRGKMQAALRGAATRAGAIGRYLWAELRSTTMATASQTWRLVRYGIASVRLSMSRRTLRRAHLALGEKLYQDGSGDASVRDAIRAIDDQIKAAKEAKRSASKSVAERRAKLIHLADSSASASDVSPAVPERERMLTCRQDLEQQHGRLEALRIRLWPSSAAETTRVVTGAGVCLLLLIAVFMLPSGHNDDTGRSADENAKGAGVPSATATSNSQTPTPAVAPFDEPQAKQHQQAWASHLDVPVEAANSLGMKLRLIPPGEFLMGSPDSDTDAKEAERPQHRVRITKPFYLGVYEVMQAQYQKVVGSNPSQFTSKSLPVETVSWEDAVAFCKRLSEMPAEQAVGRTYRLPTEAEWEYACRAGSSSKYSFGDSEAELGKYAWHDKGKDGTTHPVGQQQSNAWGLYDMHGNVSEWCADWYGPYEARTASDSSGPRSGSDRVSRGGNWFNAAVGCRSANRFWNPPSDRYVILGFRVACEIGRNPTAFNEAALTPDTKASTSAEAKQIAALHLLVAASKSIPKISNAYEKAEAYTAIAEAEASVVPESAFNSLGGAYISAREISSYADKASAYTKIARVHAKTGDETQARKNLQQAQAAANVSAEPTRAWCRAAIAEVQALVGDIDAARTTASQIAGQDSVSELHIAQGSTYLSIGRAQVEAGDFAGAATTVRLSGREGLSWFISDSIVEKQARDGKIPEAAATASQIENAGFRAAAICRICTARAQANDVKGARETLPQAQAAVAAARVESNDYKWRPYMFLAEAQAAVGDIAAAAATAQRIEDANFRAWSYNKVAIVQAKANDVRGAKVTAERIADVRHLADALSEIAVAEAMAGDVAAARQTLERAKSAAGQINKESERGSAYTTIAAAQAIAGDATGAVEFVVGAVPDPVKWCLWLSDAAKELCSHQGRWGSPGKKPPAAARPRVSSSPPTRPNTPPASNSRQTTYLLDELSHDPVYGNANRAIISEIGSQIDRQRLGIDIAALNDLAKEAKLTDDELRARFQEAVVALKSRGSSPTLALNVLSGNIAYMLAYKKQASQ